MGDLSFHRWVTLLCSPVWVVMSRPAGLVAGAQRGAKCGGLFGYGHHNLQAHRVRRHRAPSTWPGSRLGPDLVPRYRCLSSVLMPPCACLLCPAAGAGDPETLWRGIVLDTLRGGWPRLLSPVALLILFAMRPPRRTSAQVGRSGSPTKKTKGIVNEAFRFTEWMVGGLLRLVGVAFFSASGCLIALSTSHCAFFCLACRRRKLLMLIEAVHRITLLKPSHKAL